MKEMLPTSTLLATFIPQPPPPPYRGVSGGGVKEYNTHHEGENVPDHHPSFSNGEVDPSTPLPMYPSASERYPHIATVLNPRSQVEDQQCPSSTWLKRLWFKIQGYFPQNRRVCDEHEMDQL
ncbi:hypothetical protein C8R44DRAFT_821812 [Mycena epipterygia]|nr:hypothetical protein C8R44DRAFT_821812 [Mycena epipterygia]